MFVWLQRFHGDCGFLDGWTARVSAMTGHDYHVSLLRTRLGRAYFRRMFVPSCVLLLLSVPGLLLCLSLVLKLYDAGLVQDRDWYEMECFDAAIITLVF